MTLDQLRIFVAVAERQHVTRAAEALNLVQSAVSAAIAFAASSALPPPYPSTPSRPEAVAAATASRTSRPRSTARPCSARSVNRACSSRTRRSASLAAVVSVTWFFFLDIGAARVGLLARG